jgi:hypothetical protein
MRGMLGALTAAILLFSTTARADVCSDLLDAKRNNDAHKFRLLHDYPGTIAALFACAGSAASQPKDQQGSALLVYCGATCLVIGFDNCVNLGGEVMDIMSREDNIKHQAAAYSCILPD